MSEIRRRMVERDTVARFLHGFVCLSTFMLGVFSPRSLAASIYADPIGAGLIAAYGLLGVFICADTFVNDVQPPHCQLRWTSRYRHWLHVGAALLNLAAGFSQAMQDRSGPLELLANCFWFLGSAYFGAWIAWRDSRRRQGHALCGT